MFTLKKLNVVKVVATEHARDKLMALGFEEVKEQEKSQKKKEKKQQNEDKEKAAE